MNPLFAGNISCLGTLTQPVSFFKLPGPSDDPTFSKTKVPFFATEYTVQVWLGGNLGRLPLAAIAFVMVVQLCFWFLELPFPTQSPARKVPKYGGLQEEGPPLHSNWKTSKVQRQPAHNGSATVDNVGCLHETTLRKVWFENEHWIIGFCSMPPGSVASSNLGPCPQFKCILVYQPSGSREQDTLQEGLFRTPDLPNRHQTDTTHTIHGQFLQPLLDRVTECLALFFLVFPLVLLIIDSLVQCNDLQAEAMD